MSSIVASPSAARVAFGDRTNERAGAAQAGVAKAVSEDTGSDGESVAPAVLQGTARQPVDVVFDLNPFPHHPSAPDTLRYSDDESDGPSHYGGHTGDYSGAFDLPEYLSVPPGAHYRLEMPFYAKWVPSNTDSDHDNEDGARSYDTDAPGDSDLDEHRADDGDCDEDAARSPLPSHGWHLAWDGSAYWTWYYLYYGYTAFTYDNADSAGEDSASGTGADGADHSAVVDDIYAEALAYYGYDPAEFYDSAHYDTDEGETDSSASFDEEEDTEELDGDGSGSGSESDEYYFDEESARDDGA